MAADLLMQTNILGGSADNEATEETVIASFESEFPEEITYTVWACVLKIFRNISCIDKWLEKRIIKENYEQ